MANPKPAPRPDYSSQIRAQVEREVGELIIRAERNHILPDRVILGYMVAAHRGHSLVAEGDKIGGLPVHLDHDNPMIVTISGPRDWAGAGMHGVVGSLGARDSVSTLW